MSALPPITRGKIRNKVKEESRKVTRNVVFRFVVTTRRSKNAFKPGKSMVNTTMKAGARRSLHKVKAVLNKQRYRKDLTKAALRRAAVIARSQKPLPARKGAKAPAKKE